MNRFKRSDPFLLAHPPTKIFPCEAFLTQPKYTENHGDVVMLFSLDLF